MGYSKKSNQEMLEVRLDRRLRLCKMLLFIGTTCLLIFGVVSIKDQAYGLGIVLLACTVFGYVNLYLLYLGSDIEKVVNILNGILFVLSFTLLVTGGSENTGLLWIYPLLAVNLFINRFWPAVFLYGIFFVVSSLFLFTPLSELLLVSYSLHESVRFELTLLTLCLICLAALHSEERAYNMMLQVHDEDIQKLAYYDSLTGLPNRWNFKVTLSRLLKRADKAQQRVGLLYIDLDNFKQVNDNYGHEMGDKLLVSFSEQLREVMRPTDVVINGEVDQLARLAGDEFVIILQGLANPIDAGLAAKRILSVFEDGIEVAGITHPVFSSIGIAVFPDDATTADELLHHADLAMYEAKNNGRNRCQFYSEKIVEALRERQRIEDGLTLALEQNLFSLVYMPMFNCQTLELVGIEALLRCPSLAAEGIGPDRFIPVAEKTNLIKQIDLWVIDHSMAALAELQSSKGFCGKFCINISGVELKNESFPLKVKELMELHNISPSSIEFEITETAFIFDGDDKGIAMLTRLRGLGVSLALDDFGTGYTAFSQLINYPTDCLKIDRSFVNDLFSEHQARTKLVKIINNLAELYGLRVVAEGVETQEQLEYLQDIGCDWVQGFYLSTPLQWNDIVALVGQSKQKLVNNLD